MSADLYPELDDQLDAIADYDPTEYGEGDDVAETVVSSGMFRIDTIEKANWAVAKIGRHQARVAEAAAQAKRMRERIDLWLEDERRRAEKPCRILEALLRQYHEAKLRQDPKAKTLRVPAGELKARKAADQWEIDEASFVDWAKANGREDLIRRPEPQPDRVTIKKALAEWVHVDSDDDNPAYEVGMVLTPHGEIVPGVRVLVAGDDELTFNVKPHVEVDQ